MGILYGIIKKALLDINAIDEVAVNLSVAVTLIVIIVLSVLVHYIIKNVLIKIIARLVKNTKTDWDDVLFQNRVFNTFAHLGPALILYMTSGFAGYDAIWLGKALYTLASLYIIIIMISVSNRFLNSLLVIYSSYSYSAERPIKGYIQTVKIVIYLAGIIFIISILTDKDPSKLFTGLGAMAAVLIIVFRDPILGFVASIQLVANKMVKNGDWISMPKYDADGTIEDISLTTVKVQNWDKTITTIPTYALVSNSVINWVGMEKSGGRRIKRSINIDMRSVKFCDDEMIKRLSELELMRNPIVKKEKEFREFNEKKNLPEKEVLFVRKQTNLGIFRQYLETYLHDHPNVHDDMTFLVRYLQPTEKGLPLEFYVFSTDQRWANYESIQADILDHILAVMHLFELRVFQNPTGEDFNRALTER